MDKDDIIAWSFVCCGVGLAIGTIGLTAWAVIKLVNWLVALG